MHKVLIIDDTKSYVQPLVEQAVRFEIDLTHIDNWEDAQTFLGSSPNFYKAVILDGKGKLKKDGKEENVQHLTKALSWLKEQKGKGIHIHYVINTGFSEELNELVVDEKIYGKLGDEEKMFQDILNAIKTMDSTIVEAKYGDVLDAFNDNHLPLRGRKIILELLISYEMKRTINKPFNSIRDLLEIICKRANEIDNDLLPDELIDKTKNNKPNLKAADIYFSGRKVDLSKIGGYGELTPTLFPFPDEVNKTFTALVSICHILSHDEDNRTPNKYAFENALFGICEVIVCFRKFLDSKYDMND